MIFEHREFLRIFDFVVWPVLLLEEVVHLRRGELVRVSAVDIDDHGVAGLDVPCGCRLSSRHTPAKSRPYGQMPREDLLPHRHRTLRRVRSRQLDVATFERLGERKEAAFFNDELSDGVVSASEFFQGDLFAGLEPAQDLVIAHQQTLIDVVAGVNRSE